MKPSRLGRRLDLLALASSVLALALLGVYVGIMRAEEDQPIWWYVALLALGALGAGYGANRAAPGRAKVLPVAGLLLVAAGLLGILTIGLPILLAGVLCLVAAAGPPASAATH